MAVGSAGKVEQRCLAAVGVSHQCHVDASVLLQGQMLQIVVRVGFRGDEFLLKVGRHAVVLVFGCREHLNHVCLLAAQAHLVSHQLVFHRILQGSIQQHLYRLSLHKTHFDNTLAEATVTLNLHDDGTLARL